MSILLFDSGRPRNRILLWTAAAIGLITLAYSLAHETVFITSEWLLLACFSAATAFFPLQLPPHADRPGLRIITTGDVFVFSGLVLYSPEIAVVLGALHVGLTVVRVAAVQPASRLLFNLGLAAVAIWVAGTLFQWTSVWAGGLALGGWDLGLILALGISAVVHTLLTAGATNLVAGSESAARWDEFRFRYLLPGGLSTIAGASGAALIILLFENNLRLGFGLTLLVALGVGVAYQAHVRRIVQARTHLEELDDLYQATITSLAMAIGAKDQNSFGNVQKVKALTVGLARCMGINDEATLKGLRAAALLHDIGKLAVPEYILNKPGRLTEVEAAKVRSHPAVGADILETIPFPYPVVPFVRHHHERWDGAGYPDGLAGEEIPLGARILSVVDCYFGLRSDRPFRPKLSRDLATSFIQLEEGRAFDPEVVRVFLQHLDTLEGAADAVDAGVAMQPLQRALLGDPDTARAVENEVFRDIASSYREIQAVYEIAQNIGRSLNLAETTSYLSSRVKRFVPYSACSIYLVNEDERLLPVHVTGMFKDLLEGVEIRLGQGVSGWVGANNKPLVNASPVLDFPALENLTRPLRSCLSVPLAVDGTVIGVMTLYSDALNVYTEEHLRLMEAIAGHSAAAISNAIQHEEAQEDAYTDALTGLPNLRYFNAIIANELRRARNAGIPVSLLMMDLDGFKAVNDRYGHKNGDALLIEVARLLRSHVRKSDVCLRYGGDEFLGILPGVDRGLAEQTARRIQIGFEGRTLINVDGENVGVGISVGIATYPADGIDAETLVVAADRDMYLNKARRSHGGGRPDPSVIPFEKRDRK